MTTKYIISTENKPNLGEIVTKHLPSVSGFRIVTAIGYWQGTKEQSAHIEIITDRLIHREILILADEIKRLNAQQAVLVEWHTLSTELV